MINSIFTGEAAESQGSHLAHSRMSQVGKKYKGMPKSSKIEINNILRKYFKKSR